MISVTGAAGIFVSVCFVSSFVLISGLLLGTLARHAYYGAVENFKSATTFYV